ncbi:hypothetical protein [Paenibacillus sp. 453mf]|uniref:hypothetical protein n=1 Tax=Paenibacillus sp. 453mf TaxID=1761874 RepID=UPI0008EE5A6A|nr:hypothetical protein [Paenibacillus sp. 453mf]SFS54852.1 hypothetical protein SAMN04488601_1011567 [Paenibacillus sp. 453mf]
MNSLHDFFITRKAIESLYNKLRLPELDENSQDWEFEAVNSSRVNEFISFYGTAALDRDEKFALMNLIISSIDDAITEGNYELKTWKNIKKHLIEDMNLHRGTIIFWSFN